MGRANLAGEIRRVVAPVVDALGADLEDVEVRGARGSRVVRLVADADCGLDIETIAELSRRVSAALDARDLVDGRYTLEVSSPGADRPLRSPRHLRRNRGRTVRVVRTADALARGGAGEVVGTVVDVDEDVLRLEVDRGEVAIPVGDIDHARVVLPW